MQLIHKLQGVVDFTDEARGYALVKTDAGAVVVRGSAVSGFGDWFLPGYACVLGDVHSGRDSRLVAAYILSAEQPDDSLRGWQPVQGKFYDNHKAFGFVSYRKHDAYVSGLVFATSGVPANKFKGCALDAVLFKRKDRLHAHRLRVPTKESA